MVNLTSLTGLETRIISFFISHIGEQFAIREIARKAKIDYKLTHTTIQKLVKKKILLKKRQANVDLCTLNLQGDLFTINYVEMLRTQEFLQKHPELQTFFNSVREKTKTLFYTLLIFGSFAKGTETKHSDVDLLIIAPTRNIGEEIERLIGSEAVFLKRKIQTIVLDEHEFMDGLGKKKPTVTTEAFKNHFILTGVEAFYAGVRKA